MKKLSSLMAKKRGFLASLFRRRRGRDLRELSVGLVIAKLLESNLEGSAGIRSRVGVEPRPRVDAQRIDLRTMLSELDSRLPGVLAVFFRSRDVPDLILAAPLRCAASLSAPGGADPDPVPSVFRQASENIADFLARDESGESAPNAPARGAYHRYFKKLSAADAQELLWRVSGCAAYRLTFDAPHAGEEPPAFYACVEEGAAARVEKAFASNPRYAEAVRELLEQSPEERAREDSGEAGGELSRTVTIAAPREFVVGGFFLMPRIQCGRYLLESRFTSVSTEVPLADYARAPGTWVLAVAEISGVKWRAFYFFPEPEKDGNPIGRDAYKALAGCIFREALRSLSAALGAGAENPAIAVDAKPDLSGGAGLLVLKAGIGIGAAVHPCEIFFEHSRLSVLLKAFLDPAELGSVSRGTAAARMPRSTAAAQMPRSTAAALPLLFSLNQSLFRGRLDSFHREFIGDAAKGRLPFGAMLDLLPDRDCAIVLQNYVLRSLGQRSLRLLFGWSEQVQAPDGSRGFRSVVPFAFDERRMLSFLPAAAREDWEVSRRVPLGGADEHGRFAREVMEGIYGAARKGVLELSPRATFVLERMFMPDVRAETEQELKRIVAEGIPFAAVRALPKAQIQQFFGRQPDRGLCLSLLGSEHEMAFVKANVSGRRAARLEEDFAFVKKRRLEGLVEPGEMLEARLDLERSARKMARDLEKQAGR